MNTNPKKNSEPCAWETEKQRQLEQNIHKHM